MKITGLDQTVVLREVRAAERCWSQRGVENGGAKPSDISKIAWSASADAVKLKVKLAPCEGFNCPIRRFNDHGFRSC